LLTIFSILSVFLSILTLGLMVWAQQLAEIDILLVRTLACISKVSPVISQTKPNGMTTTKVSLQISRTKSHPQHLTSPPSLLTSRAKITCQTPSLPPTSLTSFAVFSLLHAHHGDFRLHQDRRGRRDSRPKHTCASLDVCESSLNGSQAFSSLFKHRS
jgi:hypothetical protein